VNRIALKGTLKKAAKREFFNVLKRKKIKRFVMAISFITKHCSSQ